MADGKIREDVLELFDKHGIERKPKKEYDLNDPQAVKAMPFGELKKLLAGGLAIPSSRSGVFYRFKTHKNPFIEARRAGVKKMKGK
jgi:hypothetical protein